MAGKVDNTKADRRRQRRKAAVGLSPEDAALTRDASLRRVGRSIALSSALSTVIAFTDSLALAGLAIRLTSGLTDAIGSSGLMGRIESAVSSLPVIVALVFTTLSLNLATTIVRERATARWDAQRRLDLIRAFRRADFPKQAGYSGAGLSTSVEQIGRASSSIGAIVGLINSSIRTAVYLGVAVVTSWQVSLICVATGSVMVLALRGLTRATRRMHVRMSRRLIRVGEEIGEMAGSARELHTLNRWDDTERFLAKDIGVLEHIKFRSATLAGLVGPVYWTGTLLVGVAVAAWAGRDLGTATSGLAASGLLLIRSLTAAQAAQTMYQSFNDARPYVDRVRTIIADLRRAERTSSEDEVPAGSHLVVEGADLTYGRDVVVPDLDLDLTGPGGIAIVGPSGSGKSTTLLALSGLSSPDKGTVSVNGIPLDLLRGDELGATIGLLPQDPKLLRGSLRSNLVRPEVERTDEQLWSAIEAVGLTETVRGFEGHMDASVGRSAEGFSGGELQRLGLARLLVNQPDVWLVDEPTSALDRSNSERVLDLLARAMAEQLVVVVTHRPELLHHCKRIVFMENGRVVDDGALDEVAARQPFVASMIATNGASTAAAEGAAAGS